MDLACLQYANQQDWTQSQRYLEEIGDLDSFDLEGILNFYILSSNIEALKGLRWMQLPFCTRPVTLCSLSHSLSLALALTLSPHTFVCRDCFKTYTHKHT